MVDKEDIPALRGQEDAQVVYTALNWVYVCVPKLWKDEQIVGFLLNVDAVSDDHTTPVPSYTRFQCRCKENNHHMRVTLSTPWTPRAVSLYPGSVRQRQSA